MAKKRRKQVFSRGGGVAILLSLTIFSCHAGDYEIKENCELIDICGDGIDNDCKNGIDDGCDCMIIGDQRQRIPLIPGKKSLELTFGPSSACKLDTEVCTDPKGDGKYKWISQKTGSGPLASTEITCDGKDDDCNGLVDDKISDGKNGYTGDTCYSGNGNCKVSGVIACQTSLQGSPTCNAIAVPKNPNEPYHSVPYVDVQTKKPDWNWSCAPTTATGPFSTAQGFVLNSGLGIIPLQPIPMTQVFPSLPVGGANCATPNNPSFCQSTQLMATTYNIFGLSGAAPTTADCGKTYLSLKCTGTGSSCLMPGTYEYVTVVCK